MGTYPITIEIPQELADRLQRRAGDLPHILELGLRALESEGQLQFAGAADVLEFLAALPSPRQMIALRPSPALQAQIETLLAKQRDEGLSPEEQAQWQEIERLEYLVRVAKAHAYLKLDEQTAAG